MTTSAEVIQGFEGYRSTPYWDKNAWRIGYGSDTMTDANGNVTKVTRDSVTTPEDAKRDLERRIPQFQSGIIDNVGEDAWNKLDSNTQAALTSLAYNYGGISKLPSLRRAIKTGDTAQISQAILNRGVDNGGENDNRRRAEAALVAGHPIPPGLVPETSVASLLDVAGPGSNAHTVQKGDTLSKIAKDNGTTVQNLIDLNGIANPNKIKVGQIIEVSPNKGAGSSSPIDSEFGIIPQINNKELIQKTKTLSAGDFTGISGDGGSGMTLFDSLQGMLTAGTKQNTDQLAPKPVTPPMQSMNPANTGEAPVSTKKSSGILSASGSAGAGTGVLGLANLVGALAAPVISNPQKTVQQAKPVVNTAHQVLLGDDIGEGLKGGIGSLLLSSGIAPLPTSLTVTKTQPTAPGVTTKAPDSDTPKAIAPEITGDSNGGLFGGIHIDLGSVANGLMDTANKVKDAAGTQLTQLGTNINNSKGQIIGAIMSSLPARTKIIDPIIQSLFTNHSNPVGAAPVGVAAVANDNSGSRSGGGQAQNNGSTFQGSSTGTQYKVGSTVTSADGQRQYKVTTSGFVRI